MKYVKIGEKKKRGGATRDDQKSMRCQSSTLVRDLLDVRRANLFFSNFRFRSLLIIIIIIIKSRRVVGRHTRGQLPESNYSA